MRIFLGTVGAMAIAALALVGGVANAANGDQYCFGGTTVATTILLGPPNYYYGFQAPSGAYVSDPSMLFFLTQGDYVWMNGSVHLQPGQAIYSATSDPALRPSPPYVQVTIAAGACPVGTISVAPHTRMGVCAPTAAARADGTTGTFLDLSIEDIADPNGPYHSMSLASYASGGPVHGLTCDGLAGLGYTDTGTFVTSSGSADPNDDKNGQAGSGHNNIYRLWVKS
jgi:hypothetical protein